MTSPDASVDAAVQRVEAAIAAKSLPSLAAAYDELAAFPKPVLAERSAEIGPRLAALLPRMPSRNAASYAVLVGALVEWNADAEACAAPLLRCLRASLERAVEFARMWRERFGEEEDLPDPSVPDSAGFMERVGSDDFATWREPYVAWVTLHRWEMVAVAVLADPRVRGALTDRDTLVELTERLEPDFGDLQCVQRALLLLDDEPLLVLDRASGRAFRMHMSGVSGNYQLQTLLAGVLIGGGHLPGEAPSAEAVAISGDAPIDTSRLDDLPHAVECFNFAEPSGRWIWSESTPSRIPVVRGVRTLVLDPPVYRHHYRAVRFLPRIPGHLCLQEALEPADAAPHFAGVRALMSPQDAARLADD